VLDAAGHDDEVARASFTCCPLSSPMIFGVQVSLNSSNFSAMLIRSM
jgi:hypothetical protein